MKTAKNRSKRLQHLCQRQEENSSTLDFRIFFTTKQPETLVSQCLETIFIKRETRLTEKTLLKICPEIIHEPPTM